MTPVVLAELAGSAGYGGGERYLELLLDRLDHAQYRSLQSWQDRPATEAANGIWNCFWTVSTTRSIERC